MTEMSTLEMLLIGALALVLVFWVGRGIKPAMRASRDAPKDWPGVLLPLAAVVLFVALMMALVAR